MTGKLIATVFFWLTFSAAFAGGDTLTLTQCYSLATDHYPAAGDRELRAMAGRLERENIAADAYPQFDLGAQASYQSQVTEIDVDIPYPGVTFPSMPRDQYMLTFDVNQLIYAGGSIEKRKRVNELETGRGLQQVEAELHQVREMINRVYFSILMLQQKEKLVDLAAGNLDARIEKAESGVRHGVVLEASLKVLKAERLRLGQQMSETQKQIASAFETLGILTGRDIPETAFLKKPAPALQELETAERPEELLFDLQYRTLEAGESLLRSERFPKIFGFAQAGYGKPGLDMLSDEFEPFYIVGAKLTWNIFDWSKNRREREIMKARRDMAGNRLAVFKQEKEINLKREMREVEQLREKIERDGEIVELRGDITKTFASKLDKGVITPTEYIIELNAETEARLNYEIHKLQLLQAKINYLTEKGNYYAGE